jgi:hypothetical protein
VKTVGDPKVEPIVSDSTVICFSFDESWLSHQSPAEPKILMKKVKYFQLRWRKIFVGKESPCKNLLMFLSHCSVIWNILWCEGPKLMLLIICLGESEEREHCVIGLSSLKSSILVKILWGII